MNTCKCITRKTKEVCNNPAEYITVVWKGSNIYLPGFQSTAGWLEAEALVCRMHINNSLSKGKSLEYMTNTLTSKLVDTNTYEENEDMHDTSICSCCGADQSAWEAGRQPVACSCDAGICVVCCGDMAFADDGTSLMHYSKEEAKHLWEKMDNKWRYGIRPYREDGKLKGWVIAKSFNKK